ncbi:hypothetical protein EBT31_19570, partial [bacterium]|nr:hypothetical protein [bacterium]
MIAMLLIPVALRVGCGLLAKRQETLLAADVAASNKRGWAAVEAHLAAIKSGGYQAWVANTPDIRGTGAMCVGNRPDALMLGRWVTETLPDPLTSSLTAAGNGIA